ncbi:hypothetical protein E6H34_10345 [Candidatus Bathyarchaeota archaeon]|nr:MAG: hypothetical protein E6H34_10345 [Candidatus Bathyarchaeota archaeon]
MFYQTRIPAEMSSGTYNVPRGQGFAYGPLPWTTGSSTLSSCEVSYAVFTFEFSSQTRPGPVLWFSGPRGNLTASLYASKYGGGEFTRPFTDFQTNIFEVSGPGNDTLHYNKGSENATGLVAMGPSSVVFFAPLPVRIRATEKCATTSYRVWTGRDRLEHGYFSRDDS